MLSSAASTSEKAPTRRTSSACWRDLAPDADRPDAGQAVLLASRLSRRLPAPARARRGRPAGMPARKQDCLPHVEAQLVSAPVGPAEPASRLDSHRRKTCNAETS